ncbi:MAG TPA: penicillin acylase family protein [Gammaproteobacteria bacterium]|nr:penicillin acylase family protein [Gammaproteobacteria bacterium]
MAETESPQEEKAPKRKPLRLLKRIAFWTGIGILVILILAGGAIYGLLRGSLPQLDGRVALVGLSAPVKIERDANGVPTITAANELDAARALGYVHAQDRFFQMDLLRRAAAGELAQLAGPAPAIVDHDRDRRRFRMRAVAKQVLRLLPPRQRALIGAYTLGVNEGLAALDVRPFEYLLLRQKPARWQPEDSILAIMAMYFDLQDSTDQREQALAKMNAILPPALYDFLTPQGTRWDSPIKGKAFAPPPIPGADVIDLHAQKKAVADLSDALSPDPARHLIAGSNNWAVAGSRTANGVPLVANDMHLHLGVPPIWYRARLIYKELRPPHKAVNVTGITLPGVPGIVAGSNGHIAWGFTNADGDWVDLVKVETDAAHPNRYRTPDGWRPFRIHNEVIHVHGAPDVTLKVRGTIWGPIVGKSLDGQPLAVHWVAQQPSATNLEIWNLQGAQTTKEALDIAARAGMPELNFVVADTAGHIGWTLAGRIPHRIGNYDPSLPASWADGDNGWDGWLDPAKYPRIVDPDGGLVWTANNRVVGGKALAKMGDGGYALGARAQQVHADLKPVQHATPAHMLAIQLDDRARFLSRWHDLLLRLITPKAAAASPRRAAFRRYVAAWGGKAAVDSVGYRLVRLFHERLRARVLAALLAPVRARAPHFEAPALSQFEGSLWELVEKQPANLLPPRYKSWDAFMLAVVDSIIADHWQAEGGLAHFTWGKRNTVQVRHPLSYAVPLLAPWLDMPVMELPGDHNMPRVQAVSFGASMRMDVAPGDEQDGIFELPGGESGHPMSPYYGDEFKAWATGKPTPFLPGPTEHVLMLVPAKS